MIDFGPQYSGDDPFKARARLQQSRFRVEELGLDGYTRYGNRLTPADAAAGKNFYPCADVLEAVRERYGLGDTALSRDMLRSEHIPFNVFVPLRRYDWARDLIASFVGAEVTRVSQILIEWAPEPKREYLDDNTSFDTYIEYVSASGAPCAIGIEVKYTEREYPWGQTERLRVFDERSPYLCTHRASGLYQPDALDALRTRRHKQLWRNQLLGEAMLQREKRSIERVTSLLLFPGGNEHFVEVTREYSELLVPERRDAFAAVTFEDLIERCRALCDSAEASAWLSYLERRYVV